MASTVRSEGSDDLADTTAPLIGIPPSPPLDASMTWGIAAPAGDDGKTTTRHRARPAASKRQSPCLMGPLLGARLFERVIAQVFGPPDYGSCLAQAAPQASQGETSVRYATLVAAENCLGNSVRAGLPQTSPDPPPQGLAGAPPPPGR